MKEMNYILNDLFKNIRKELGYTQKEFSKLLHCTQVQVSRIENNEREVSDEILATLSTIYNLNLLHYKYYSINFKTFEDYILFYEIAKCFDSYDLEIMKHLEKLLENPTVKHNFTYGEPRIIKNLAHALVQQYVYKNYEKAKKYCLLVIHCNEKNLYTYVPHSLKSSYYYSCISVLANILYEEDHIELALEICKNHIKHMDEIAKNKVFTISYNDINYKRAYLKLLCSYALFLHHDKQFEKSIEVVDFSLIQCYTFNILNSLVIFLNIKMQCLYELNKFTEAKTLYDEINILYKYSYQSEETTKILISTKENFAEIFQI